MKDKDRQELFRLANLALDESGEETTDVELVNPTSADAEGWKTRVHLSIGGYDFRPFNFCNLERGTEVLLRNTDGEQRTGYIYGGRTGESDVFYLNLNPDHRNPLIKEITVPTADLEEITGGRLPEIRIRGEQRQKQRVIHHKNPDYDSISAMVRI